MGHMTSGLGGLAPFFRRFLQLLNGYTPFFQPFFGHFWPPVNGFLPSPSGWDCSDFTMIGAFCKLLFPWKGHSNGIIVDDYGTEWLVQLTNGKEVPVYKDEVFIV